MVENKLRPREAIFVREYLRHGEVKAAAVAAGAKPNSGSQTGAKYLKIPAVIEALQTATKAIVDAGIYNLQIAMKEAEEAMAFAKVTENANAYTKAVELRAKLNGLMVEKHDIRQVGFHVSVGGIDFSKRDGVPQHAPAEKAVDEIDESEMDDTGEDLIDGG